MTTKHTTDNRLDRLLTAKEARTWGECAAMHNESWSSNPYPVGSYFWIVWGESYNATLTKLVEQAIATGQITAAQERMDMAEPHPSMWQRVRSFAAWVFRKPAIGDG